MAIMLSKTIPGIEVGSKAKSTFNAKDTCYFFCSFEEALARLRKKNKPKDEEVQEDEESRKIIIEPPPPKIENAPQKTMPAPARPRKTKPGCIPGTRIPDLVGKKYNMLTVIAYVGQTPRRQTKWLCRCECGTEKVFEAANLKSGSTKSCGCMRKAMASEMGKSNHGNAEKKNKRNNSKQSGTEETDI